MEIYKCKNCGIEFTSYLKDGKFCGRNCYYESKKRRIETNCNKCGKKFKATPSKIRNGRRFCSKSCSVSFTKKGTIHTEKYKKWLSAYAKKKGFGKWMLGRKGNKGVFVKGQFSKEKHPNWKGGISPRIMSSDEYVNWRKSVFKRDDFRCQWCGKRGKEIHADHIKPYYKFPKDRFIIKNGRTLCVECDRRRTSVQLKVMWKNQNGESKHR